MADSEEQTRLVPLKQPTVVQRQTIVGTQLAEGGSSYAPYVKPALQMSFRLSELNARLAVDYPDQFKEPLRPVIYIPCTGEIRPFTRTPHSMNPYVPDAVHNYLEDGIPLTPNMNVGYLGLTDSRNVISNSRLVEKRFKLTGKKATAWMEICITLAPQCPCRACMHVNTTFNYHNNKHIDNSTGNIEYLCTKAIHEQHANSMGYVDCIVSHDLAPTMITYDGSDVIPGNYIEKIVYCVKVEDEISRMILATTSTKYAMTAGVMIENTETIKFGEESKKSSYGSCPVAQEAGVIIIPNWEQIRSDLIPHAVKHKKTFSDIPAFSVMRNCPMCNLPSNSMMTVCKNCCKTNVGTQQGVVGYINGGAKDYLQTSFLFTQEARENRDTQPNGMIFNGTTGESVPSTKVQRIMQKKGRYLYEGTRTASHNQVFTSIGVPKEMDYRYIGTVAFANEKNDAKMQKKKSKDSARAFRRWAGGNTAPFSEERGRVPDMAGRVTAAIRHLLNASRCSDGIPQRDVFEQLVKGEGITPLCSDIDQSKKIFAEEYAKKHAGAVTGTNFVYARAIKVWKGNETVTDYIPVTYEIEDTGEVLGWSPSQVMEPYNIQEFNDFMQYMEDTWDFKYNRMQRDILFVAMSAVSDMLKADPLLYFEMFKYVNTQYHRAQTVVYRHTKYDIDQRTGLRSPYGPDGKFGMDHRSIDDEKLTEEAKLWKEKQINAWCLMIFKCTRKQADVKEYENMRDYSDETMKIIREWDIIRKDELFAKDEEVHSNMMKVAATLLFVTNPFLLDLGEMYTPRYRDEVMRYIVTKARLTMGMLLVPDQ